MKREDGKGKKRGGGVKRKKKNLADLNFGIPT